MTIEGSRPVTLYGFQYEVGVEPVHVSVQGMIDQFQQGLADLESIWRCLLSEETVERLLPLRVLSDQQFRLPDDLWAQVVYDAAVAYAKRVMPRDHLLKSLVPLYLGRTASFVLETQGLTSAEAEGRIEMLCQAFEKQKPYLIARWESAGSAKS